MRQTNLFGSICFCFNSCTKSAALRTALQYGTPCRQSRADVFVRYIRNVRAFNERLMVHVRKFQIIPDSLRSTPNISLRLLFSRMKQQQITLSSPCPCGRRVKSAKAFCSIGNTILPYGYHSDDVHESCGRPKGSPKHQTISSSYGFRPAIPWTQFQNPQQYRFGNAHIIREHLQYITAS